ncbi:MAG: arginine--tRNA ligase, partial [Clostridiales bacterium]|nr:arginine--tRNA ligase [Clostridiales bacterium]
MNPIIEINEIISSAFEKCGYDFNLGKVAASNRPDLCQFTCNGAMAGAKIYKKPPLKIASDIVDVLRQNPIFDSVDAVPPGFINISLSNEYYESLINKVHNFKDLIHVKSGQKIILDYGGPNVAKPLHVGHLRSAIIGESIKRIAKALGYKTISDIHLGDWGLPMGLIITEIQQRYPDLDYFKEVPVPSEPGSFPISLEELNEIYPTANSKAKADDNYKLKAQEATKALQSKDNGLYSLWKSFVKLSTANMKKIYDSLNVNFDLWNGESTCDSYVEPLINKLISAGLTYESNGALVVDIKEGGDKLELPPIIIRKSDGAQLYSTTDLATIMQREHDHKPNQIIYIVDNRQSLHFTQVFRCAKKGNILPQGTHLEFVGFGTMNGKDGKPYKTRDGGVMQLSELIRTITAEAYDRIGDRVHKEATEAEKTEIARKIGIAALKFGDLYNHRGRDYIFDMDRF